MVDTEMQREQEKETVDAAAVRRVRNFAGHVTCYSHQQCRSLLRCHQSKVACLMTIFTYQRRHEYTNTKGRTNVQDKSISLLHSQEFPYK